VPDELITPKYIVQWLFGKISGMLAGQDAGR